MPRKRTWFSLRGCAIAIASTSLLSVGCEAPARAADQAPSSPVVEVPPGNALYALSMGQLQHHIESLAAGASEHEASVAGVRYAREGARVARAIIRKGGSARYIDRGRRLLALASRRKGLAGACEAALELARLEAMDARDSAAAYLVAYRTTQRFSSVAASHACVSEARRMMAILSAHRPAQPALAAAAADPDSEDPGHAAGAESLADDHVDVAGWAARQTEPAGPPATLRSLDVYGAADAQAGRDQVRRVVLQFDSVAVFKRTEQPAEGSSPRQLILDLDGVAVAQQLASRVPVQAAGLRSIGVEADGARTRVVFDVEQGTQHRLFFLTEPYRIVMDFQLAAQDAARARKGPVIVLDAGHGGQNPGAQAFGLKEAHLTMKLARKTRAVLRRKMPEATVVLTRDGDDTLSLEERAAMANGSGGDLFVSIHLNASHSPTDRGGVSTFVLDTTDDQAALRLAARENGTDAQGVTDLQFILASLIRKEQVTHSRELARHVQKHTLAGGRRHLPALADRGVKSSLFYVLVGVTMPAVLVEASFLTRPEEAKALQTEPYRFSLADGIARGIMAYFEAEKQAAAPR